MTYGQPPVCRRQGCSVAAVDDPTLAPGDQGWCAAHLGEVRAQRAALTGSTAGFDGGRGSRGKS
jgi:hypothetical protein